MQRRMKKKKKIKTKRLLWLPTLGKLDLKFWWERHLRVLLHANFYATIHLSLALQQFTLVCHPIFIHRRVQAFFCHDPFGVCRLNHWLGIAIVVLYVGRYLKGSFQQSGDLHFYNVLNVFTARGKRVANGITLFHVIFLMYAYNLFWKRKKQFNQQRQTTTRLYYKFPL